MSYIGSYRLFNALENGQLTGAQLDALLASQRHKDELEILLADGLTVERMLKGTNALFTLLASGIAAPEIYNHPTISPVLPSRPDLAIPMLNTVTGRMIIFNSDTILEAVNTPEFRAAANASPAKTKFTTTNAAGNTSRAIGPLANTSWILIGLSTNDQSGGATITVGGRRSGSNISGNTSTTNSLVTNNSDGLGVPGALFPFNASTSGGYTIVSTDTSSQTFYVSLLRCDA